MRMQPASQKLVWNQVPFLRLLLPFLTGIFCSFYFPSSTWLLAGFLCVATLQLAYFISIPFSKKNGNSWFAGLAIQIFFFLFGTLVMHVRRDIQIKDSPAFVNKQHNYLLLQILGDPVSRQKSYKCSALVKKLINGHSVYYEREKILVYFNKKTDISTLSGGTWILIRKPLQPIENFKSSDFDYKKYCRLKHIYAQVFLNEDDYINILHENKKSFFSGLDSLRKKLLAVIKSRVPNKSEYGLLEALLVGFTDDLDPEILKSYADSGVIHIIAISGLHLALICHILQVLLIRTGPEKSSKWIKLIILTVGLWSYALLAGGSPSVIRAAAMFSLVIFAKNILREIGLYNALAASAFLLICFDPFWIWDTGFQLSYAAVLSLGLFSQPVRNLLPLKNKILVSIWGAASVSIAAQLLTTPVSIYYFHRFPSYFMVANLLAVPLSSGILVGGILLCICSPFNLLAHPLGWLLGIGVQFLNGFINYISRLPGAVIEKLVITLPQLFIIYLMIFCIYQFMVKKDKYWLFSILVSICVFQLLHFIP